MKLEVLGKNPWDRSDLRNEGVVSDELVGTSQGVSVRRVIYRCPLRAQEFRFLTSECTLPPGLIAHLYRQRWEIEKTFDELKNKLGERKAWASSPEAKAAQAHFLCLAHHLMLRCERRLEREEGVRNEAEIARRASRLEKEQERLGKMKLTVPVLVRAFQRLTVRSFKFIRWLIATLRATSPRAGYRHPAPLIRQFARDYLDTVDGMTGGTLMPVKDHAPSLVAPTSHASSILEDERRR